MTGIKAIETRYAGCRFRSRLEARWAVLFDTLGIRWEYEREGYSCSPRLSDLGGDTDKINYLPDFWLPDHELHGEVKATLTDDELLRLLDCAASLSSNDGSGCHDNGGDDLVVFGNIPRVTTTSDGFRQCDVRLPTRLHMHKGNLEASGWDAETPWCHRGTTIAGDYGGGVLSVCTLSPNQVREWLTTGSWADEWSTPARFKRWENAYRAARSARFEHGEHG